MHRYLLLLVVCYLPGWISSLGGQSTGAPPFVRIVPEASQAFFEQQQLQLQQGCGNVQKLKQELQQIIGQLQLSGFLEAAVDSIVLYQPDSCTVAVHLGPKYQISSLVLDSLPESWRQDRILKRLSEKCSAKNLPQIIPQLLMRAADIGYPLARTHIQILQLNAGFAAVQLKIESGSFIRMGELLLPDNAGITAGFLSRYLGVLPGTPYQHSKIIAIPDQILALGFLSLQQTPEITFTEQTCFLSLQPQATSQRNSFDFMIGVLPQANNGNLLLTTSLRGALNNTLGRGESIRFNFERLRPQTQTLELSFNYPYLLHLPLATHLQFDLYKRDTSFLDVFGELGFQYLIKGNNYIEVFWNQHRSSLIQVPEKGSFRENILPGQLDLTRNAFGIGLFLQQLDYPFNPRKGYSLHAKGSAGNRNILPNERVKEAGYQQLYENITLKSFQVALDVQLSVYWPLFGQSTLKTAAQTQWLFNSAGVFRNEQFRLGGSQNLRGFDEEFWLATRYFLFTLEYRLLLDRNAYLAAFGDWARITDDSPAGYRVYEPLGLGAGFHFSTKAGQFQLSLAYGKTQQEPWDLSNPKVHFGYVSLF